MGIWTLSLNTKKALVALTAAAFAAMLLAIPATVGATDYQKQFKIKVNKSIDKYGNEYFRTDNSSANTLGFRWGLDGGANTNTMGTSEYVTAGTHTITENNVPGYELVGWFEGYDGSCKDAEALPVSLTVGNNNYESWSEGSYETKVTLCNKFQPTITVKKQTNPNGDQTPFSITATTSSDGEIEGDATRSIMDDGSVVYKVSKGTYSVTEAVPAGWTQTSNTCSNLVVTRENPAPVCEIVNTKNATPVVQGTQVVAAPVGGVGAGSGSVGSSLAAVLGLAGSLGAVGFGLRQARKN